MLVAPVTILRLTAFSKLIVAHKYETDVFVRILTDNRQHFTPAIVVELTFGLNVNIAYLPVRVVLQVQPIWYFLWLIIELDALLGKQLSELSLKLALVLT